MTNLLCGHYYISGQVQGVWYRASAKEQAEQLGLKGWTRNLTDGRVEVLACGPREQLELFHQWLKKGPELARVETCAYQEEPWQVHEHFVIYR